MPLIKADTNGVNGLRANIRTIKSKNDECYSNINQVKWNLDWQVKAKKNISGQISSLQRRINCQEEKLEAYIRALETTSGNFAEKDRQLSRETKNIIYGLNNCQYAAMNVGKAKKARSSKSSWLLNTIGEINDIFSLRNTTAVSIGLLKAGADFIYTNAKRKAEEIVFNVGRCVKAVGDTWSTIKSNPKVNLFLENVGKCAKVVGDTWSVIKPYAKVAIGAAEVIAGVVSLAGSGGLSTPVSIATVIAGVNTLVEGVTDIADGNGEGKDGYNLLADGGADLGGLIDKVHGGNGEVGRAIGETVGTIGEISVGVVSGYGIAKTVNAANKAEKAKRVITSADKVVKNVKEVKSVYKAFDPVCKVTQGKVAEGTMGIALELIGGKDVFAGRPTSNINFDGSIQDQVNILVRGANKTMEKLGKVIDLRVHSFAQ